MSVWDECVWDECVWDECVWMSVCGMSVCRMSVCGMSVWRLRVCGMSVWRMTLVANFLSRLQGTGHLSECASRGVIHKKLSQVSNSFSVKNLTIYFFNLNN
jgi:hypothetical protein